MIQLRRTGILLILLAMFTGATVALRIDERNKSVSEPRKVYYLTAFEDANEILAVQIENQSGKLTMISTGGQLFTDTSMKGIGPNQTAIPELFRQLCRIQVGAPIENADFQDEQFGLQDPQATVFVEDQKENGIQFVIGKPVPGEQAFYAGLSGGETVYTLSADYEDALLGNLDQYLDLRVFQDEILENPSSIAFLGNEDGEEHIRCELRASGKSEITGMAYYSFTDPVELPLATALFEQNVLQPLREMAAVGVQEMPVSDPEFAVRITVSDDIQLRYLFRKTAEGPYLVTNETLGTTFLVPAEQVDRIPDDCVQILDKKLLSLNAGALEHITLEAGEDHTEIEIEGSNNDFEIRKDGEVMEFSSFSKEILDPLGKISVENLPGKGENIASGSETVLTCRISERRQEQEIVLEFVVSDGRKSTVCVNGIPAFTCDLSAIRPLIAAVSG